ncbi:thioredoxin-related transmembrane protein 1-like [Polyodon spathula]|uniref:thioredoxin-related transmembrane protein 1-like n=1 Tax=Polyodon spathula TaxID=7913 RepID=UPI001B7F2D78|nr:thioredoxin-related transmembrane protein 1-like [Polyodon spathula]
MASLQACRVPAAAALCKSAVFSGITLLVLGAVAPQPALGKRHHQRTITERTWQDILEGEWMIEFFAPWCPACQQLQPEWNAFAEWGEDIGVSIAKVDVTEEPGLSGRFIITALPTIYHCKDGVFRKYEGGRTKNDFLSFIDEKKWREIEPVSSWFGPSSFLMNTMSGLFKLSMFIRHCHNYFTEHLGLPVWGSYAIFALATLFSGLVLGLILVFVADCVFPFRRFTPQNYQRKQSLDQARIMKRLEAEQEADGEADEEDEYDYEGEEVWRKRGGGGGGGRSSEPEERHSRARERLHAQEEEEGSPDTLRKRNPATADQGHP